MQFSYNSDHPEIDPTSGIPRPGSIAQNPEEFPQVVPIPCAKITTRVYHPVRNEIVTVQNVLVRTASPLSVQVSSINNNNAQSHRRSSASANNLTGTLSMDSDDDSIMSSSSSSFSDLAENDIDGSNSSYNLDAQQDGDQGTPTVDEYAYWTQRTIREAIYGRVLFAVILRKRRKSEHIPAQAGGGGPATVPDWIVTDQFCAVKEMSWQHIRKDRDRLAEDPIKEVAAMQYFKIFSNSYKQQMREQQQQALFLQQQSTMQFPSVIQPQQNVLDLVADTFQTMIDTNVMLPLDLLSDERYLYSVMPYCDGGELFERLDLNEQFTEDEARYWMNQILNGLENLQHAGICHRDISLENLLVHNNTGALIIDMGMCLLLPFVPTNNGGNVTQPTTNFNQTPSGALATSFQNLNLMQQQQNMNVGFLGNSTVATTSTLPGGVSRRYKPRYLVRPQGTCGKWIYMSPEILRNKEPFDGYAVDMWAAGVILFLMLTGFPPWERADLTDERFKYMSGGYLVQMLTEWEVGISGDALDLLQRMLFYDPKDRLSLDQVRAHPWMLRGNDTTTAPVATAIPPPPGL